MASPAEPIGISHFRANPRPLRRPEWIHPDSRGSGFTGQMTDDAERWAPLRLGKYMRSFDEIELAWPVRQGVLAERAVSPLPPQPAVSAKPPYHKPTRRTHPVAVGFRAAGKRIGLRQQTAR